MEPILFSSNSHSDDRGTVFFTNELNLKNVIRTYKVQNKLIKTVRAWHGHKLEEKWISVEEGEFLICAVQIEDFDNPSSNIKIHKFTLTPVDGILYVPNNYANGAMNITENNSIRYFSSLPLDESVKDDYRFDSKFWDPWSEYKPNFYE